MTGEKLFGAAVKNAARKWATLRREVIRDLFERAAEGRIILSLEGILPGDYSAGGIVDTVEEDHEYLLNGKKAVAGTKTIKMRPSKKR